MDSFTDVVAASCDFEKSFSFPLGSTLGERAQFSPSPQLSGSECRICRCHGPQAPASSHVMGLGYEVDEGSRNHRCSLIYSLQEGSSQRRWPNICGDSHNSSALSWASKLHFEYNSSNQLYPQKGELVQQKANEQISLLRSK